MLRLKWLCPCCTISSLEVAKAHASRFQAFSLVPSYRTNECEDEIRNSRDLLCDRGAANHIEMNMIRSDFACNDENDKRETGGLMLEW